MKILYVGLFALFLTACGDTNVTQTGGGSDTVVDQDETAETIEAIE